MTVEEARSSVLQKNWDWDYTQFCRHMELLSGTPEAVDAWTAFQMLREGMARLSVEQLETLFTSSPVPGPTEPAARVA